MLPEFLAFPVVKDPDNADERNGYGAEQRPPGGETSVDEAAGSGEAVCPESGEPAEGQT